MASLVAQMVKNLPAMQETWVRSLGWEDPWLGGGHGNPLQYSCLENPHGQRSLAGCSPWGRKELDMTERLTLRFCSAFRAPSGNWDADSTSLYPPSLPPLVIYARNLETILNSFLSKSSSQSYGFCVLVAQSCPTFCGLMD